MKRYRVPHVVLARDFVPIIAHDLRAPVTTIKGYSQLVLRQATLPAQVGDCLTSIVDEANNMASLIDDIVLVSQIERGDVSCQLAVVDLGHLLPQLLDRLVPTVPKNALTYDPSSETVLAYCDPELVGRAVSRLSQFALKYFRPNEVGHVAVRNDDDQCVVWISDRPVAKNHLIVTSLAKRTDISDARDHDFGRHDLRMYICARLVELQNGSVFGSTGTAEGNAFCLTLPSGSQVATAAAGE